MATPSAPTVTSHTSGKDSSSVPSANEPEASLQSSSQDLESRLAEEEEKIRRLIAEGKKLLSEADQKSIDERSGVEAGNSPVNSETEQISQGEIDTTTK